MAFQTAHLHAVLVCTGQPELHRRCCRCLAWMMYMVQWSDSSPTTIRSVSIDMRQAGCAAAVIARLWFYPYTSVQAHSVINLL
jgi:hypothetical protein